MENVILQKMHVLSIRPECATAVASGGKTGTPFPFITQNDAGPLGIWCRVGAFLCMRTTCPRSALCGEGRGQGSRCQQQGRGI